MTDLNALEALCERATGAPWTVDLNDAKAHGDQPRVESSESLICVVGNAVAEDWQQHHHDAAFIAASRSALPALVAEVRRLREALETSLSTMLESRDRLLCYHARTGELDHAIDEARSALSPRETQGDSNAN